MRTGRMAVVVAAAVGAAVVPLSGSGTAWAEDCVPYGADFNGDGCGDIVVADPDATVGGVARAGRVNVLHGGPGGARLLLTQGMAGVGGAPETDDRFGAVIHVARIDDDAYADLVVAVPSESIGSAGDAGIVHVIFGSASGLGGGKAGLVLRQGRYGVPGTPEAGDRFGAAIAVNTTDLDGAGYPAPAIAYGVPGEDLGSIADAGVAGLVAFDGATGAVAEAADISQDSPGISGAVEAGDRFGGAVEVFQGPGGFGCGVVGVDGLTLVVGTPGEDLGSVRDAGMIHLVRGQTSDSPLTQDSPGVDGVAEAGDQFGARLALTSFCEHDGPSHVRLAVGVPTEDIGSVRDAGAVHLFLTDDDQFPLPQQWSASQDTPNVAGTAETGDRFGSSLALSELFSGNLGAAPVVVGVPGEDIGSKADAGAVQVFGDQTSTPGIGSVSVDQSIVGQPVEAGDHFGAALATRLDFLIVGAPDDATYSTGVVHAIAWQTVFGEPGNDLLFVPGSGSVPGGAARFGAGVDS